MRRVATERDAASARSAFRNITAELFARAVYLRFDRAHRQLQLGSDLIVGVFLEKAQLDQFAGMRGDILSRSDSSRARLWSVIIRSSGVGPPQDEETRSPIRSIGTVSSRLRRM